MSRSELAHSLIELQYSDDRKGPWELFIYGTDGFHDGGLWFNRTGCLAGEIRLPRAQRKCEQAISDGHEVRICDGGDNLVFHAKDREVLYGANFWQEIGA